MVIADGEGRVLTVRQRGGPFRDAWLLPGGGVEAGESPEDAVRREVAEETGLEVVSLRHIRRYEVRLDDGGGYHGHVDLFGGEVRGTARPGHDEEPIDWVRPDSGLHPLLIRELRDAGFLAMEDPEVERRAAQAGIAMRPLARDDASA